MKVNVTIFGINFVLLILFKIKIIALSKAYTASIQREGEIFVATCIEIGTVSQGKSIDEAIKVAVETNAREIFITGGGEIYKQTLPFADKVYLTRVDTIIDGDAFFPEMDLEIWEITFEKHVTADEKNKFDVTFQTWEKKLNSF